MIAFASRYGHQPLLAQLGPVTAERLQEFNDALQLWLEAEAKKGGSVFENAASGGG